MSDNQIVPESEQDVEGHVQLHGPEGFPGGDPEGVVAKVMPNRRVAGGEDPEGVVGQPTIKHL